MSMVGAALAGVAVGHVVRRGTPWLLGLRDRSLPFAQPWVELVTAIAFVALVGARGGLPSIWGWLLFAALLASVTACDVHSKLIPDLLTLGTTGLGLAFNAVWPAFVIGFQRQADLFAMVGLDRPVEPLAGVVLALVGAAVGFAVIEGFRRAVSALTQVEGMGMGDAKLLMAIGAFLGPVGALVTLLPACVYGALAGGVHKLVTGKPHAPFGPALAAGAVTVVVAGEGIVRSVWHLSLRLLQLPPAITVTVYLVLLGLLVGVLLRLRRRADVYRDAIDEDYRAIEAELRDDA